MPYTSNHWNGGTPIAVDIGVTMPNGSNRATTAAENNALYAEMANFGFQHTGATFAVYEQWHYEYHGGAKIIAPVGIKLATVAITPAKPTTTATAASTKDDNMFLAQANSHTTLKGRGDIINYLFKVEVGLFEGTLNGQPHTYQGRVTWLKGNEAAVLKSAYAIHKIPADEIWNLALQSDYERNQW